MLPALVHEPVYVSSPAPSIWAWGDNSSVAVWMDDRSTAAFAVHLGILCRELNVMLGGLPSLTAIITLVSACQRAWSPQECETRWEMMKGAPPKSSNSPATKPVSTSPADQRVIQWLSGLHRIHASIRSKPELQAVWIADRLRGCRGWLLEERDENAQAAIDWLSIPDQDRTSQVQRQPASRQRLQKSMESLIYIAREPLDIPRLESLCKLGVDVLPPVDVIELPEANPISRFLERLTDDSELGAMVTSALSIAANLSLPRQISQPDVLPMGGVSDITNRGTPERLLLSELAVDPMLLMARMAHGQALYLRREIPPQPETQRRLLMIEHGIRTWGEGRSQLLAMALGIAVSQERRGIVDDYMTVAGDTYWKECLENRAGLEEYLRRLIPAEHPGEGMMAAYEEWISQNNTHSAETVLLLSENTFLDKRFQESIRNLPTPFYIASIAMDGHVQWLRRTRYGDEVLQRLSMQTPTKPLSPDIETLSYASSEIPRYLVLQPGPLRINVPLDCAWFQATQARLGKRVWIITNNNQLMMSLGNGGFAQEIASALPCRQVLAWHTTEDGIRFVLGNTRGYWLVSVKNDVLEPIVPLPIDYVANTRFFFDRSSLFAFFDKQIVVLHAASGQLRAKGLSQYRRKDGVFHLDDSGHVRFPTVVQEKIVWQDLGKPSMRLDHIQSIFRDTHSVPILVDHLENIERMDGVHGLKKITRCSSEYEANTTIPFTVKSPTAEATLHEDEIVFFPIDAPARNGTHFSYMRYTLAELDCRNERLLIHRYRDRKSFFEKLVGRFSFFGQTPRTRVRGIASDGENLCLIGRKGELTKLNVPMQASMLSFSLVADGRPFQQVLLGASYSEEIRGVKSAWKLRRAAMGDCIVWSDSRGLLHLRAPNGQEMTLGLHESNVSIWFHGEVFGTKEAIGSDEDIVPSEGAKRFLREFAKACMQPKSSRTIF